jgi:hypothetical protein
VYMVMSISLADKHTISNSVGRVNDKVHGKSN